MEATQLIEVDRTRRLRRTPDAWQRPKVDLLGLSTTCPLSAVKRTSVQAATNVCKMTQSGHWVRLASSHQAWTSPWRSCRWIGTAPGITSQPLRKWC